MQAKALHYNSIAKRYFSLQENGASKLGKYLKKAKKDGK